MKSFYENPDFLQPIGNMNRDEVIVVPFERGLKNINFAVMRQMLFLARGDRAIRNAFPRLEALLGKSAIEMYDATCLFKTPAHMLYAMSDERLDFSTCITLAEEWLDGVEYENLHETRLEYVCFQLLKQSFVKHLYIITDKQTTSIGRYCFTHFREFTQGQSEGPKVSLIAGNLVDFLAEHHEVTTVFLRSAQDIFDLQRRDYKALDQKYFVLIACLEDMEMGEGGVSRYKQEARLKGYMEGKICSVVHMYPYAILPGERNI